MPRDSVAEAVAIRGDQIIAVGSSSDMLALAGPGTRKIDLGGRAAVPGFVDGHPHMDGTGLRFMKPSFDGAKSIDDVLAVAEARGRASTNRANGSSAIRVASEPEILCVSRGTARRPLAQPARPRQGLARQPRLYRAARADRAGLRHRQQRRDPSCRHHGNDRNACRRRDRSRWRMASRPASSAISISPR